MGWADNIILAMAPLGVMTIIVGAIRVGGPSSHGSRPSSGEPERAPENESGRR